MKRVYLVLLLTAFFINAFAQRQPKAIHIIQILDFNTAYKENTNDPGDAGYIMSKASASIKDAVVPLFSDLANSLNLQIKEHIIYDPERSINYDDLSQNKPENLKFTPQYLDKILKDLKCENDIVVVLYSGHGFSFEKTGNISYPNLMLNYNNDFKPYVNYGDVLKIVHSKKPTLVISIVSACQTTPPSNLVSIIKTENRQYFANNTFSFDMSQYANQSNVDIQRNRAQIEKKRASELFLLPKYNDLSTNQLSVELISSSHGEQTYINNRGGHFIRAFRDVMTDMIKSDKEINWQEVAFLVDKKTKEYVTDANKNLPENEKHKQTPQCIVYAKGVNGDIVKTYPLIGTVKDDPKGIIEVYAPYTGKPSMEYAIRLTKLSNTYREAGSKDFAMNAIEESLETLKGTNSYFEAVAYENRAMIHLDNGNTSAAKEDFQKALSIYEKLNAKGSVNAIKARIDDIK